MFRTIPKQSATGLHAPVLRAFLIGITLMAATVCFNIADEAQITNNQHDVVLRRLQNGFVPGLEQLRVATFGSSMSWGAGLENRTDAYPFLLSDHADNYAMLTGGPNFPAVCAQTLVGNDKIYDIIILEYWLSASDGLEELANRLRTRFPNALVFLVKLGVTPEQARRKESKDAKGYVKLSQWISDQGLENSTKNHLIKSIMADDGYWFFPERHDADKLTNDIREDIGNGFRVKLPTRGTGKDTLIFYLQIFNDARTRMTPLGHEVLANMTKATMQVKLANSSPEALMANATLGSWGHGDYCEFWSASGSYVEEHSPEIELKELDKYKGEFALAVSGNGYFTVSSSFFDQHDLYITYLTTGKNFEPPKIRTQIGTAGPIVELDPRVVAPLKGPRSKFRTIPIGKINPGKTKIFVTVLEETGQPFQIVGYTLASGAEALPMEFEYGPNFGDSAPSSFV